MLMIPGIRRTKSKAEVRAKSIHLPIITQSKMSRIMKSIHSKNPVSKRQSDSNVQMYVKKNKHLVDKIHVIHSWADPQFINPIAQLDNWFSNKYGLTDSFVVLYSGNSGRFHDSRTMIKFMQLLYLTVASRLFCFVNVPRQHRVLHG